MEHNMAIDNRRMGMADIMGQMLAQIVNKIKPDKVPHPQIKIDMPEHYEGDPVEIDNWLRSMETYFTLVQVTNLSQTIIITLQQIQKGKGNQAGAWSVVKLKEWVEMEKEFEI